jgi:hypothetical protein
MRPRHLALVLLLVQAPTSTQFGRGIEAPLNPPVPAGVAGPVVLVPADGDLQAALDAAVPGTTIRLASGATYTGNFILRSKAGAGAITVRAGDDVALPPGQRVGPASASVMAKLQAPSGATPILTAEDGASHYTLIGLELAGNATTPGATLVEIGRLDMNQAAQTPTYFTFDRLYVHADPGSGGHRGLELNVANGQVLNSYISGFWQSGQDSQAIAIFNGPGPLLIRNNYLEASGENFLSGGQDPSLAGLIPSDLTITGNYFFKPLAWKTAHPGGVKNLFELKSARRATITSNVFENVWIDGQSGSAVLFTVRNQNGNAPWSTVRDVVFSYNVIKNAAGFAMSVLGLDDTPGRVSVQGVNLTVTNNLFVGVNGGVMLASTLRPSTFAHNTMLGIQNTFLSMPAALNPGVTLNNNVVAGGLYGIAGNGTQAMGLTSLNQGAPAAVMLANVIEGNAQRTVPYPPGNHPLPAGALARLLDPQDRYLGTEKSTDGMPLGADIAGLLTRISWVTIP